MLIKIVKKEKVDPEFDSQKGPSENVVKDHDPVREGTGLGLGLVKVERLELVEKLNESEKECEELREKLRRANEYLHSSNMRAESAEQSYARFGAEQTRIRGEMNKEISLLKKENVGMKCKILEHERLEGMYKESFDSWNIRIAKLDKEIQELREENVAAQQMIKELERKELKYGEMIKELRSGKSKADEMVKKLEIEKLKADEEIEELRKKNLEAAEMIEKLMFQKVEAEKAADFHMKRLKNLQPRLENMEKMMYQYLRPRASSVMDTEQYEEIGGSNPEVDKSPRNGHAGRGEGGRRILLQSSQSKEVVNAIQASGAAECNHENSRFRNNCPDQKNATKGPPGSGSHGRHFIDLSLDDRGPVGEQPLAPGDDIILITDSDEDVPNITTPLEIQERLWAKRKRSSCKSNNEDDIDRMVKVNKEQSPLSSNDRSSSFSNGYSLKPNLETVSLVSGAISDIQTPLVKFEGFHTDGRNDSAIASDQSQKQARRWLFGDDVLRAFKTDPELCMSAVCALYRIFRREKSTDAESTLDQVSSVWHFKAMGGPDLAEYLIDGDPEFRLKKSVREVNPDDLSLCRTLASEYYMALFHIYYRKEDPFFR